MLEKLDNNIKKILYFCLAVALLVSAAIGLNRIWLEVQNIKVETVMGYSDVQKLRAYTGTAYAKLFAGLKNAGITSLAVEEGTLSSLKAKGEVSWYKGEDILNLSRLGQIQNRVLATNARRALIKTGYNYILFDDVETYNLARDSLLDELGPGAVKELGGYILEIQGNITGLGNIGLGISRRIANTIRNYGFNVIPRLVNSERLPEEQLSIKLSNVIKTEGVKTIIFSGNSVLGYNNNIALITNQLKQYDLNFGFIEFANQKGSLSIAGAMPEQTIGVHSISDYSMNKLTPGQAIARYVRAVAERGMRILYVRPFLKVPAGEQVLPYNLKYISQLKQTLEARHFQVAPIIEPVMAKLFLRSNMIFLALLALGVAASLLLFLRLFFVEISSELMYSVLGLFLLLTAGAYYTEKILLWRSILALAVAMIYPVYALVMNVPQSIKDNKQDPLHWKYGIGLLVKMISVVLLGALLIIGILSDSRYMLKIYQFSGVKLAYIFPVLFTAWYYLFYPRRARSLKFIIRRFLQIPVNLGAIIMVGLAGIVLLMYVGRSGNFNFPVFSGEDIFRQILNTLFFVRPRTKEFIIGYPVFLVFISFFGNQIVQKWKWLFLSFSVIGLVSLLNTFCHIHAPIFLSVLRSFNGFILGILVGLAYILIINFAVKLWKYFAY